MTEIVSLLPPNATVFERALEAALVRPVPVEIGNLWNPQLCPEAFLPHLAWSLSVSNWRDDWPVAIKRAAIAQALPTIARRGTIAAVRAGLLDLGVEVSFVEGWQVGGPSFTFQLLISIDQLLAANLPLSAAFANQVRTRTRDYAPVRCDFTVAYAQFVRPTVRIGATMVSRYAQRGDITPEPRPLMGVPRLRVGATQVQRTRVRLTHDALRRAA